LVKKSHFVLSGAVNISGAQKSRDRFLPASKKLVFKKQAAATKKFWISFFLLRLRTSFFFSLSLLIGGNSAPGKKAEARAPWTSSTIGMKQWKYV
jgi:hypothetical protein